MKKVLSLMCVLGLVLSFAACGSNNADSTAGTRQGTSESNASTTQSPQGKNVTMRFTWWGSDSRHQATLKVIELYKSKNPNVTIEAEYGGADGYKDKRMTEMAGGNAPDIMQIDAPWLYDLKTQFDPFADLGKFSGIIDISGFDANFVSQYGSIDGITYGLPTGINAMYMLMNTSILDAAGIDSKQSWTWDSVLSDGAKVHANNPDRYFLNLDQHSLEYHVLRPYIKQLTNEQLIKDDNSMGFTEADLTAALTYVKKLFDEGVMQPASESFMFKDAFYDNPIWANNNVGANLDWVSSLTARKAGFADTAAVGPIPRMANAQDTAMLVRPAQLLNISSASANQEEAAKFVNFFFNDPEAIGILKLERSVPATVKARDQLAASGDMDPQIKTVVDTAIASAGKAENSMSANTQFETILTDAVEKVAYGESTPEQAAKLAVEQFQSKINELKQ